LGQSTGAEANFVVVVVVVVIVAVGAMCEVSLTAGGALYMLQISLNWVWSEKSWCILLLAGDCKCK